MKKITAPLLLGSLITVTLILSGCGKDTTVPLKAPKDTTKLIRGVALDDTDWTWFVGTDSKQNTKKATFTSYFTHGIPAEVKHFQYFLDTDNNAATGFSFGQDSWKISGVDILVEDGAVYKSQSKATWKWLYIGELDKYTRSEVNEIEQIYFASNKTLLGITEDIINITIEPFDTNWNSTYSTISTQAVKVIYEDNDSDHDGFSNQEEETYGSDPLDKDSYPHIIVTDDTTNKTTIQRYEINMDLKNTHDDTGLAYYRWTQGISILNNGFYITTRNQHLKGKDTYTIVNLHDKDGKSVANAHLNYGSHAQDLSIEKVAENIYNLYSVSKNKHGIVKWKLDTSNIDFKTPKYTDKELTIELENEIEIDNSITSITSSLNENKDKFISVGYLNTKKVKFQITDKSTLSKIKSFEFSIDFDDNGKYNQGIAMKGDKIYFLRGGRKNDDKRLFVLSATSGKLLKSYHFNFNKTDGLKSNEPEGIVIKQGSLFITYNSKDTEFIRRIRLYKIIDL